ncbi:chloramphenicol resistance leader peptide [Microbacterium maritypicum]|uniref:Uncharacterized protein n=1 Tax=Microbacterium sorbitolivorans TaxID=1867410 RepID=A0A367XTK4_9MICO|nr:chloramphenicol resistance leader peptide [Tessaracoccus sp. MC1627]MBD2765051.1 chloramphenicol resistance leader peptide [Kocuria sp. cx-455]MCB1298389.1 chloramphenicol resistance leader peptide [Microthrixaceae bacterium]QCP08816.1 hypothetical protein FDF08_00655 [Micrococcus luteus]RCK56729.1 hypothetical protein DTO57_14200 [Microbacterium sorbitolivorans]
MCGRISGVPGALAVVTRRTIS